MLMLFFGDVHWFFFLWGQGPQWYTLGMVVTFIFHNLLLIIIIIIIGITIIKVIIIIMIIL